MARKQSSPVVALFPGADVPRAKRRYTKLSDVGREKVVNRIAEFRQGGSLGKSDYARIAEEFSLSSRTIESLAAGLRAKAEPGSAFHRGELPEDALVQIASHGQLRSAWAEYHGRGVYAASYDTFRREVHREHGANTVRGVTKGVLTMRNSTFEKQQPPLFMQRVSADLFYVRAPIRFGRNIIRPAAIVIREASSKYMMFSWVFDTADVNSDDVRSVYAECFRGYHVTYGDRQVFIGGIPDIVRCDQGSVFISVGLDDLFVPLGIRVVVSNSYRKHEGGAHERVHEDVRSDLFDHLPGSEDGPRDHRGELIDSGREPMTLEDLRVALDKWAWRFNTTVAAGETQSPIEKWIQHVDESGGKLPLRAGGEMLAKFAHDVGRSVKREKLGLRLNNAFYTSPALEKRANKRFEAARWLRDERTIEVFTPEGEYLGEAVRNGTLTAAESTQLQRDNAEAEAVVKVALKARDNRKIESLGDPTPNVEKSPDQALAAKPAEPADHLQADVLVNALRGGGDPT